jgi:transposase
MGFRRHDPPAALLFGYDPVRDLPPDHLARLIEMVVEEALAPKLGPVEPGQPKFDPRLCAKVLIYGYSTGVRSSRQLERHCAESLPYLFLTRGDTPSYRTLCSFRVQQSELLEEVFVALFSLAGECGMKRLGRIVVDSSKFRADASPDSVVRQSEYEPVLAELKRILEEAQEADLRDEEQPVGQTQTGVPADKVAPEQMREILRRIRCKKGEKVPDSPDTTLLGPRMRPRIEAAIDAIEEARKEDRKHACLTDPDARMMGEGREKPVRECHSFEVAVDAQDGLLVAAASTNIGTDNSRLSGLVEAAQQTIQRADPAGREGVTAVDADSGYYSGSTVAELIGKGIDTCIPDSNTACDLHRGHPIGTTRRKTQGSVALVYDPEADCYRCPEGNILTPRQTREQHGQVVMTYRARHTCAGCPLASMCLTQPNAKRRTLKVGKDHQVLEAARQQFSEPGQVERYRHRAEAVETIFGFLRSALGFHRWSLRGNERVACEARLFKLAYQFRKVCIAYMTALEGQNVALSQTHNPNRVHHRAV